MPQYQDPAAADALRYLRGRTDALQKQIDGLKATRGKVALDRGDHVAQTNPYEGEVMVNYLSDKPYHYARGAWHPFGGGEMPWARRSHSFTTDQSIANNSTTNVTFDNDYNMGTGESGEGWFSAGSNYFINILQPGVYALTAEVTWTDAMTSSWAMAISSDYAAWIHTMPGYFEATGATPSGNGMLSMIHRYNPNNIAAGPVLSVYQRTGASKNLNAAYLEIVRLGDYTGTDFNDMDPDQ